MGNFAILNAVVLARSCLSLSFGVLYFQAIYPHLSTSRDSNTRRHIAFRSATMGVSLLNALWSFFEAIAASEGRIERGKRMTSCAFSFERQDVGNIVFLEHINLTVEGMGPHLTLSLSLSLPAPPLPLSLPSHIVS